MTSLGRVLEPIEHLFPVESDAKTLRIKAGQAECRIRVPRLSCAPVTLARLVRCSMVISDTAGRVAEASSLYITLALCACDNFLCYRTLSCKCPHLWVEDYRTVPA